MLLADVDPAADLVGARSRLLADPGAFPAIADALDLRLRTDLLVPLSRWVTPPSMPRRFDARFFAAAFPEGAAVTLVGDEVLAQAWHRPIDALESMAAGDLGMWLPTSTTLMQLEHASSIEEIAERLAPGRARRGRGRGRGRRRGPDRDAGRWRRRRPARQRVPGRSGRVRARGSGRPDRGGAGSGARGGRRAWRADRGDRADPRRSRPRGRRRGRRRAARDPGARGSGRRAAPAVRDPRARAMATSSTSGTWRCGSSRRPGRDRITWHSSWARVETSSPAISMAFAASGRSSRHRTRPPGSGPWQLSVPWRRMHAGSPATAMSRAERLTGGSSRPEGCLGGHRTDAAARSMARPGRSRRPPHLPDAPDPRSSPWVIPFVLVAGRRRSSPPGSIGPRQRRSPGPVTRSGSSSASSGYLGYAPVLWSVRHCFYRHPDARSDGCRCSSWASSS